MYKKAPGREHVRPGAIGFSVSQALSPVYSSSTANWLL